MKYLFLTLFAAAAALAQCPLGFTPDAACDSSNPSCALFTDANGDSLCDNPGPQGSAEVAEEEPEPDPEIPETPAEPETVIDPEPETPPPAASSCPFGLTPAEACDQTGARCALYTDGDGDGYCDNPGPRPVDPEPEDQDVQPEQTEPDIEQEPEQVQDTQDEPAETEAADQAEREPEPCPLGFTALEACSTDAPICALYLDTDSSGACDNGELNIVLETDTLAVVQEENEDVFACPLGLTVEEACEEEAPICALYTDADEDGRCDNPGSVCAVEDSSCGIVEPSLVGCPLGLTPEVSCPDTLALCPHWYGVTSHTTCANPAGGARRTNIVLIALAVLLPVSTFLSRRFFGKRLKDKLRRNTAHHVIRGVSLMVLGFGIQGCFCPLGTFQYAFTDQGLAFLGLAGILIFLLPLVFSAFFGRVFCGWVCPMGALQEFLYRIHIPGRISPRGPVHRKLRHLSQVILFALIAAILLNRFEIIQLPWVTPFCRIDPFHTVFTLFLSGSLIVAGIMIITSIFIRRFFCRYLCFYGAAQGLLARLKLWSRITRHLEREPELDSDEEFDR